MEKRPESLLSKRLREHFGPNLTEDDTSLDWTFKVPTLDYSIFLDDIAVSQLLHSDQPNSISKKLEHELKKSKLKHDQIIFVFQKIAQVEKPMVDSHNIMGTTTLLIGHLRLVGIEQLLKIDGLGVDGAIIINRLFGSF